MANNLPRIGDRYRLIEEGDIIEVIGTDCQNVTYKYVLESDKSITYTIKISEFNFYFKLITNEDIQLQLEDILFHKQEFEFERECEKYVDECAMRAMQASFNDFRDDPNYVAESAYDMAEAMLKEKLKRNDKLFINLRGSSNL